MSETFYGIKVNENLIWDYSFKEEDYKTDVFFFWYIFRVLNNGNSKDVKTIPLYIIKENLSKLNLSQKVKYF